MSEFNIVWKILKTVDHLQGLYATVNPDQKLSIIQRIYQPMWMFGITGQIILIISTIFMNKTNVPIVLQCIIMLEMYVSAFLLNIVMLLQKKRVRKVLLWAKEMQALDNIHMNKARVTLAKTIKRLLVYFVSSYFGITYFMIIIAQVTPEEIYPRFRPPQPFELPLEDRDNWTIYSITCFMQVFGVFYGQLFPCLYYSLFFTFCIIFYAYLNTLLDEIYNLNDIGGTWAESSFGYSSQNELIIKEKMNEIAEKYCQAFEIFKSFTKQTSFFILVSEFNAFSVLLFTGILGLVSSNDFLSMAAPMNVITCFFFLISLLNEKIQTKVDDIYESIYDLPWYAYSIKQRKHFFMVLQCNLIHMKLNAGGLHPVSVEQFGTVVQTAYSAILVIKNMLELQK